MNKEIEDFRILNDIEMEKEIENTRQIHLNEIEGNIKYNKIKLKNIIFNILLFIYILICLFFLKIGMIINDDDLKNCMKEDMENAINDVRIFFDEKFEKNKLKVQKKYEIIN
jgi:hypothetical protein